MLLLGGVIVVETVRRWYVLLANGVPRPRRSWRRRSRLDAVARRC